MYGDDGHCGVKVIRHDIVKLFDVLLLLHQRCIIRLLQTHHHEPYIHIDCCSLLCCFVFFNECMVFFFFFLSGGVVTYNLCVCARMFRDSLKSSKIIKSNYIHFLPPPSLSLSLSLLLIWSCFLRWEVAHRVSLRVEQHPVSSSQLLLVLSENTFCAALFSCIFHEVWT
jgi:hypothetical protein